MKKVLIGCAIVVAVLLAIGVGSAVFLYSKFKGAMGDPVAREAVKTQLEERDGPLAQQVPPLDGVPSAEAVQAYLTISRQLAPRFDNSGESLVDFFLRMNEKQNPLRRAVEGVRGSMGLTHDLSALTARLDSLLLETGISEGELAYVYALHRYGMMSWQPPSLEESLSNSDVDRKARREAAQAIEGVESEIDNGLGELLQRQMDGIQALPSPTAAEESCRIWLEPLLGSRSIFDALRNQGLTEAQRMAFASLDTELRALVPSTPGAYFVEMLTLGVDTDGEDSVNFDFSSE